MATKLNLQPSKKEYVLLTSFESTSAAYKNLPVDIIQVQTVAGVKTTISVLIVSKIAPPLQNLLHTLLQNILYLKGLQLAHPMTDNENLEISVLIRIDYYWSFVEDHVICGSGPIAV